MKNNYTRIKTYLGFENSNGSSKSGGIHKNTQECITSCQFPWLKETNVKTFYISYIFKKNCSSAYFIKNFRKNSTRNNHSKIVPKIIVHVIRCHSDCVSKSHTGNHYLFIIGQLAATKVMSWRTICSSLYFSNSQSKLIREKFLHTNRTFSVSLSTNE